MRHTLANPPIDERSKELWLQHAAGFTVFENIRKYAIEKINDETNDTTKSQIIKGINDTIYAMMMQMDGVFESLENEKYRLELQTSILLYKNDEVLEELNTLDGDGMCMAYHDWLEGDFGEDKIIEDE